jgi:signal peptidase II
MQAAGGASLSESGHRAGRFSRTAGRRLVRILLAVAGTVVAVDQLTKTAIVRSLAEGDVVTVVDGWLDLTLVRNPGAAFSFATGYTLIITAVAAGVCVAILRMAPRLRSVAWAVALGGLLGGALGNLVDRIFREPAVLRGHVVDFVEPAFFPAFPSFNVADAAIVCSSIAMVVLSLLGYEYDGRRVGWAQRRAESRGHG